ncbi:MAG: AAA family ATPase [Phycisphaerales bacterium]
MTRHTDSILDQLAQEARIMKQARMLPQTGPLTPQQIEQVRADFIEFTREQKISNSRVSKALGKGFSQATLSKYVNGKDSGDAEGITRALNQWMEDEAYARQVRGPDGFVETDVAVRMLATIRTAKIQQVMGLIYGPAGVGKTMTAQAARALFPGSIYLRINQSNRRGPGFVKSLSLTIGISARNALDSNMRALIDALRDSGRLLLVDEAHQAHETGLEAMRDIHDEAGIPIVLVGTSRAKERVTDTSQYFGQFSSRIAVRCDVTEQALRPKNPKPLYSLDEIMEVFGRGKVKLTKDAGQFLMDIANVPGLGGLRICDRVMRVIYSMTQWHGKYVAAAHLMKVFQDMHGESFVGLVSKQLESRNKRLIAVA